MGEGRGGETTKITNLINMTETQNIAAATLRAIREEVAADSPLFSERLLPAPGGDPQDGYSGLLAAAGDDDGPGRHYCFALEYIFEGYLLHYGDSRLLRPDSTFFSLLAGDYMYARGLDRLAALGDLYCIRMMAELISLCSFIHCHSLDPGLALRAWTLTTLGIAERTAGGGSDDSSCGTALADLKENIRSGGAGRTQTDPLLEVALSSQPEAARKRLKEKISRLHSGFSRRPEA